MSRSTRAALVVLLLSALVAAGCGVPQWGPDPTGPTPATADWDATVTWRPCPEVPQAALARAMPAGLLPGLVTDLLANLALRLLVTDRTYECATLTVPRDWYAAESHGTFEIAMVRVRSDAQSDRIGSLFVNPGGPGASGVDAAVHLSLPTLLGGLPDEITRRFDIVGFDPRGVGRSNPVECFTDADLDASFGADPDPVSTTDFEAAVAESQRRVDACAAHHGETLRYYSTRQTAHDLQALRAAVGDEQLTYLGYSYGTLLGAVYAQLYPTHVRALVLDGAVDPRREHTDSARGQAAGFARAFDNFTNWCDTTPAECRLGPDSRSAVTDAVAQARRAPVSDPVGRAATAGWVFWAVVSSLYVQELWPHLGTAIHQLGQGDPSGVFMLADLYTGRDGDGAYSNMFDANTAINCTDSDPKLTVDQIRDLQQQWRDEYPLFGAPLAVMALECALWPAPRDPYPVGPANGAPPTLVVGTTGDPATPYESTAALAELLGTGVVLTWDGEGHTVYPQRGCVNRAVNAYLVDLTVPADGTTCSPTD